MFIKACLCFVVIFYYHSIVSAVNECIPRDYDHGTIVCVCNATYCDTTERIRPIATGNYVMYSSNKDGWRFKKSAGVFHNEKPKKSNIVISINSQYPFQEIFGWGGAFTDATGFNIQQLPDGAKQNLLKSYFSEEGIEYSLCRVPIGCSDFSLNFYTYADTPGDVNLTRFNLTKEDFNYKIPFIKDALKFSNNKLKLFATIWSPPVWMKTSNKSAGMGFLKREYYQTYADYHIKFLDAYRKENLTFWGLTTGNEPILGLTPFFDITSLGWLPWDQGKWIAENLGPSIRNNTNYSNIKIIAYDDERLALPFWMWLETLGNKARNYIDGIGIHWYTDPLFPVLLTATRFLYPDKFLLGTEACTGDKRYKIKVVLGNWRRGEQYVDDIMEDLKYSFTGWVDWNMALDLKGGPTYIKNLVDSSIIVNATSHEFYKQPTYYTMGHFSKFVPPGSRRIFTDISSKSVKTIGFMRPDGGVALIIYNRHGNYLDVNVYDQRKGFLSLNITPRSVNTLLYW